MKVSIDPVSTMNCENCGAPLKLEPERHYLFCEYCNALYFPKESPEGLYLLGAPSQVDCPLCRKLLVLARIGHFEVLACQQCKGLLLDMVDFLSILEYLRLKYPERRRPPQTFDSKELARELHCPHCASTMETYPYGGAGNVVLDNCLKCGILWLDYDEVSRIVQTPERVQDFVPWLDITSIRTQSEDENE
jgi:Zn-finger nucleic acid-binding protein/DNA-directed RNA polymerase subunit RPC12/RpoP